MFEADDSAGKSPRFGRVLLFVSLAFLFWTGVGLLFASQLYILREGLTWSVALSISLPRWQISWIQADGTYMKLHLRDGTVHLQRGLLGSLDSVLDERCFVRIHRSAIVNIDVVEELRQDAHGEYIAVLRDRTQVRVGRRFRERLQARLGQDL